MSRQRALDVTQEAREAGCGVAHLAVTAGVLAFTDSGDEAKRRLMVGQLARLLLEAKSLRRAEIAPGVVQVTTGRGQRFVVLSGSHAETGEQVTAIATGWEFVLADGELEFEVLELRERRSWLQ